VSRSRRGRRWLGVVIAAVLVIGAAGGAYLLLRPSTTSATGPTTVTRDVTASLTTLTTSVGASGTMQPAQEASLGFTSAGTVTSVTVAVGDKVTVGQPLAAIDPTDLQSAVDAAQASVDAASADVTTAEDNGSTAAAITAAKSTLKTKQNALEVANTALAGATLTAPFDGTVAAVAVAVGDKVGSSGGSGGQGGSAGGSASSSSTTAITVITADRYTVSVGVGSADIGKITKGMKATVTPSGASKALDGTVTGVGVIASTASGSGSGSNTASFPVTITLDDAQTNLYAGISASVHIITSSRDNVLVVPSQAITTGSDGTSTVQKKQADGTYLTTQVRTGQVSGSQTEITAGLANGDTVQVSVVVQSTSGASSSANSRGGGNLPNGGGVFPNGGGPYQGGGGPGTQVQITGGQQQG